MNPNSPLPGSRLEMISTRWPLIRDPALFVLRYAPAIDRYLTAIVQDRHEVEEITQDFLVRMLEQGSFEEERVHGRFRNYLKVSIRNAAFAHLRKKRPTSMSDEHQMQIASPDDDEDAVWLEEWRRCLLDRVWDSLKSHERQSKDNWCHQVLKLFVDYPDDDSPTLSARLSKQLGKLVRAEAFRKQLSRARTLFAQFLVQEVVQTIENPSPDRIEAEMYESGLLPLLKWHLPEDWNTGFKSV